MRELGEGQFGKVLLMTAKVLTMYKYVAICDRLCENQPCSHLVVIRETFV